VDGYRLDFMDTSGTVGYISIYSVTLEAIYNYSELPAVSYMRLHAGGGCIRLY